MFFPMTTFWRNSINSMRRMAVSQPFRPRYRLGIRDFLDHSPLLRGDTILNSIGQQHADAKHQGARDSVLDEMPPQHATLTATRSNFQIPRKRGSETARQSHDELSRQRTLKPESIWRKNRMAFLKQMDRKLEEAMAKFAHKFDNGKTAGPLTPSSTTSNGVCPPTFKDNPLQRKRGRSYHLNGGGVVGRPNHSTSQSMAFEPSSFPFNVDNASPSPMEADFNDADSATMNDGALNK